MPVIGTDGSSINQIRLSLDDGAESHPPRIAVMFSISLLSLLAVSFPNISKRVAILRIPHLVFFIGKHFGTGVILSTAFGHLLPDAFDSLRDKTVRERYPNIEKWTGMIILGSLLTIFLVEYISTTYVDHLHAKSSEPPTPETSPPPSCPEARTPPPTASRVMVTSPPIASCSKSPSPSPRPQPRLHTHSPSPASVSASTHACPHTPTLPVRPISEASPLLPGHHHHHTYGTHRGRKRTKSLCGEDEVLLPLILLNSPRLSKGGFQHAGLVWGKDIGCVCPVGRLILSHEGTIEHGGREQEREDDRFGRQGSREREGGGGGVEVRPRIGRRRQVVGILVLQFGIMIHSLVIGLTLAVTYGTDFTSLVTAIMFHQLFEGLSLGIRMASLPPAEPSPDPSSDTPLSSASSQTSCRDISPSPNSPSEQWSWKVNWLTPTLSILFAITTPLGIGIGMAAFAPTSTGVSQAARMGLIQGVLSAISAGMLIYAATVEMLGGDFVFGDVAGDHGHSHDYGHGHEHGEGTGTSAMRKRLMAVASLLAGVLGMGLVGLGE